MVTADYYMKCLRGSVEGYIIGVGGEDRGRKGGIKC